MRLDYDNKVLFMGLETIDLNDYPKVEVLGVNCTGLDHLPWKQIEERGIKVISIQGDAQWLGVNITSTAEHTMGLILAISRNYKTALNEPYKDREEYKGHVLKDKELLIIGFGRVGKQIWDIAEAFKMKIWALEKKGDVNIEYDQWISKADYITLHIPLVGNEGFFTKEMFKQMKPTAYLINTSRDAIIEKGALIWALENRVIAGAAIDFIDDPELVHYARDHTNLVLTNHIAGATWEDQAKTEKRIQTKVEEYLKQ